MIALDEMKAQAAQAALEYLDTYEVIGIGSGTTVDAFLGALEQAQSPPRAAVAASFSTAKGLARIGVETVELAEVERLPLYIDGADELDPAGRAIKGRGGAHTTEKLIAAISDLFVCIVDETKLVDRLGQHAPVPLEVIPEAVPELVRELESLGGVVSVRGAERTDLGNALLDVSGLDLSGPETVEVALDALPGVVECGIFARRTVDIALIAHTDGSVETRRF